MAYLFAPQYEGLSIKHILAKVKDSPQVLFFLPDELDWHRLPRQWLINVCNTVIGKPFAEWINATIEKRNDDMAQKHDLLVEMDPDIAEVFANSKSISSKCLFFFAIQSS